MRFPSLKERVFSILLDAGFFISIPVGFTFMLGAPQLAVVFGYGAMFYSLVNTGTTPGKNIMGLKLVNEFNKRLTTRECVGRMFGYMFSLIFGIGFIFTLLNKDHISMHDFFTKTYVVKK
jgi:uncharacterized RDD family membrane protein YckC